MPTAFNTCRACAVRGLHAGPSRPLTIHIPGISRGFVSLTPNKVDPLPFFTPPYRPSSPASYSIKGKEKAGAGWGQNPEDPEREVSDKEWEMRVGSRGQANPIGRAMLHLRETLPHFFHPDECGVDMCPPDVFSRNLVLKLPVPFPLKISSLAAYTMVHSLTRNGMSALHTDLNCSIDRMSFSPSPQAATAPAAAFFTKRIPAHRYKQIRVSLSIRGNPRLPPHKEAIWNTSSLYTFSPYSGLISVHEVEKIRPLPGEGVGEWLASRLLGWTSRHAHEGEGAIPIPSRAVVVPRRGRMERKDEGM